MEFVIHNPVPDVRNRTELPASPALARVEVRRAHVPSGMVIDVYFVVRRAVRLVCVCARLTQRPGVLVSAGLLVLTVGLLLADVGNLWVEGHHRKTDCHRKPLALPLTGLLSAHHGQAILPLFHHERRQIDLAFAGVA